MIRRRRPDYRVEIAAPRRGPRLFRRLRDQLRRLYHAHLCRRCLSGSWRWLPLDSDPHHHMRVPNLRVVAGGIPAARQQRARSVR